jgi:hypothetical protein
MLPVDVLNAIIWATRDVVFAIIFFSHVMKRWMRRRIRYGCDSSANIIGGNAIILERTGNLASDGRFPNHWGAAYENSSRIFHAFRTQIPILALTQP